MEAIKTTAAGLTVNHIGKRIEWWEDTPDDQGTYLVGGELLSARHYKRGKASLWVELKFLMETGKALTLRVRPKSEFFIHTRYTGKPMTQAEYDTLRHPRLKGKSKK